jgi:hypothetical protein
LAPDQFCMVPGHRRVVKNDICVRSSSHHNLLSSELVHLFTATRVSPFEVSGGHCLCVNSRPTEKLRDWSSAQLRLRSPTCGGGSSAGPIVSSMAWHYISSRNLFACYIWAETGPATIVTVANGTTRLGMALESQTGRHEDQSNSS